MKQTLLLSLAAALLLGCGGDDAAPTSPTDSGAVSRDTSGSVGTISVKVRYTGARKGPLTIGAFPAPVPASPPVSFDTSKAPTYPYDAELRDMEPGTYWVVALIDVEPLGGSALRPGPEDLQTTSAAVEVKAGEKNTVELTLTDAPSDAGTDGTAD